MAKLALVNNGFICKFCFIKAFVSTGILESYMKIKKGKDTHIKFSEQNLMDCTTSYGNTGCDGGLMSNAFDYVKNNEGLDTSLEYPLPYNGKIVSFK